MHHIRFDDFSRVFLANVTNRVSTPLVGGNTEASLQVKENTENLIKLVWDKAEEELRMSRDVRFYPKSLRDMCEVWHDTIQYRLVDSDAYEDGYKVMEKIASRFTRGASQYIRVNRRYRMWDLSSAVHPIPPIALEAAMDEFYTELYLKLHDFEKNPISQAEFLAYADHTLDAVIHPWAFGCGWQATAMVMWLSLLNEKFRLPQFGTWKEHYAGIEDLQEHTKYYERCLNRN